MIKQLFLLNVIKHHLMEEGELRKNLNFQKMIIKSIGLFNKLKLLNI